ncbi:hypothetical protein GE061_015630 [Apolygus lucorum]|uniref:Leucine-rich repeat-containing protein 51 n=1 Tax=Apolygus lucorum TaxID=248454 RepID=A0A8S9XLM5_APOLU|nr:hypothetical protein GE061_015630 [Apolygus lucorum]
MASIVAEIEKTVLNKYLSEELNIETKLHHLNLDPSNRVELEQKDPEKERFKENQTALKRNKDILKETDLVVARYRSRSLYSPVDGHLQACKLSYLKRLKELKHREQIRRFRHPPQLESVKVVGADPDPTFVEGTSWATKPVGILKNSSRPSAYLVTDTPTPFPRTTLDSSRKSMSDLEHRGAQSTPPSAGLFRISGEPLPGGLQGKYRQIRSTPGSAGTTRSRRGSSNPDPSDFMTDSPTTDGAVSTPETKKSQMENFGPPLDYSFKGLTSIETLKDEKPRKGVKTYKKSSGGRYSCTSLRLNNNYLDNINGIHATALQLLELPEKLTWLDLSFNKLTSLAPELASLKSLKIIYLHGNHLVDLPSVLKPLKLLDGLYSLTLHGNPLEERKGYRNKVIATLPSLKSLDFNNVTSADRKRIAALQNKKKSPNAH